MPSTIGLSSASGNALGNCSGAARLAARLASFNARLTARWRSLTGLSLRNRDIIDRAPRGRVDLLHSGDDKLGRDDTGQNDKPAIRKLSQLLLTKAAHDASVCCEYGQDPPARLGSRP